MEDIDLNEWAEENLIEPVSVYFESELVDEFVQAESLWENRTELSLPTS